MPSALPSAEAPAAREVALAAAAEHLRQGRLDAAEAVLRGLLAEAPDDPAALSLLAGAALARGDSARAQAMLEAALQANPRDAPTLANLAMLHAGAGRAEAAGLCLDRAEGLAGPTPGTRALRARLLAASGEVAAAGALLEALCREQPEAAERHYELGVHHLSVGEAAAAEAAFRAAISRDPGLAEAWHNLGQVLVGRGALADGTGCLRRALLLRPGEPATVAMLAEALLRGGEAGAAAAEARRGLVVAPEHPLLLVALGRAEAAGGRIREAMASLARAVRAAPANPLPLLALGEGFAGQGDAARAAGAAAQALARGGAEAAVVLPAADLLLRTGRFAEAWDALARLAPAEALEAARAVARHRVALPEDLVAALALVPALLRGAAAGLALEVAGRDDLLDLLAPAGIARAEEPGETTEALLLTLLLRPDPLAAPLPRLAPDPARVAAWREALEGRPRPVVAIAAGDGAWGEPPLPEILAALGSGGTRLALLPLPEEGRADLPPDLLDGAPHLGDLRDLAAALAVADRVVVAAGPAGHLAGLLGCPGVALVPPGADWCWGVAGPAPWYPSLRPLRLAAGDWRAALAAEVAPA